MATSKAKPTDDLDPVSETFKVMEDAGLGSLSWMGTAYAEAWSNIGNELVSFVAKRVQEDVATQQAILKCRSVADVQKVQAEFLSRAVTQYTEETGKLVDLSTSLLPSGLQSKSHSVPL